LISKADKGNSTVIVYQNEYHRKFNNFISNNNFRSANNDTTQKFQKDLRNSKNNCQLIIHKDERWKYINLNPIPPMIRGLTKIHKEDSPIRPVVNWKNAPAYKLAKMLSKKLSIYIPLPHTFNVKHTVQLMSDLREIPFDQNLKIASFDITNMYSNVPTGELTKIIDLMCNQNDIKEQLKYEIMKISQILIKQNYFQFQDTLYIQEEGLAMGAPTSSVFSEICWQHIENTKIIDIILEHHILGCFRYVDDILVVYKNDTTNIHDVLDIFNSIIPTTKFIMEDEKENKINFRYIAISKENNISFNIYRKPTSTDTAIPNDSCHPQEHKLAAIRY
jgi:hypothetical protein